MRKSISVAVSILLMLLLVFSVSAADGEPTIQVGSAQGARGETVTVDIAFLNNPGINTCSLEFVYDTSRLELIDCVKSSQLGGLFEFGTKAVWLNTGDTTYSGTFFTLSFRILADAPDGTASVSAKYNPGDICNYDEADVSFHIVSGSVSIHEHTYTSQITASATCTEDGTKTYTCPCGDSYTEAIPALGHAYSDTYTVDKAATCAEEGSKSRYCTHPGCTANTDITAIEKEAHTHKVTATKKATCTKAGSKTYTCSCGDTYTETIAKLGHKYSSSYTVDKKATCAEAGSKSRHCTRTGCTAKTSVTAIAKKAHTYKSTTTKATLTKNGKTVTKCTACGYITKTVTVYSPKTFKLSATAYTYNGKTKTPSVTVKDSKGKTLTKDTDYTVKYASGRKTPGKYAVTVTFKGKYSGTKTLYFNILPTKTSKVAFTNYTTSIKATWTKVTGATGYKVELLNAKGKVLKTAHTLRNTYTFKSLSKVTTYQVRITAYKTIDSKKVYAAVSTKLTTATAPAAVAIGSVRAGSKQATLAWKTVTGASGYEITYSPSAKFTNAKTVTVTGGTATVKKLTKGKKYYFKVRAYKLVNGEKVYGAWSTAKSTTVK